MHNCSRVEGEVEDSSVAIERSVSRTVSPFVANFFRLSAGENVIPARATERPASFHDPRIQGFRGFTGQRARGRVKI